MQPFLQPEQLKGLRNCKQITLSLIYKIRPCCIGCAGLRATLTNAKFGVEVQLQVCLGSLDL